MTTIAVEKKRKNIDIPVDVFRSLSVRAAYSGISLKSYIENILAQVALKDIDDAEMYRYLSKNKPDGDIYLNDEEQAAFEKWLEA
jgi:hypothetical protein